MKPSVAIALIVCGTFIVITPAAYNFLLQRDLYSLMVARTDLNHVRGGDLMSSVYQFGCWALGAAMVAVAIIQSVRLPMASVPVGHPAAE